MKKNVFKNVFGYVRAHKPSNAKLAVIAKVCDLWKLGGGGVVLGLSVIGAFDHMHMLICAIQILIIIFIIFIIILFILSLFLGVT